MVFSFEALGFAFLCLMNLNAIDLWEREEKQGSDYPMRDFMLTLPLLDHWLHVPVGRHVLARVSETILLCDAGGVGGLLMLDHFRAQLLARVLLRVLADVALVIAAAHFLVLVQKLTKGLNFLHTRGA